MAATKKVASQNRSAHRSTDSTRAWSSETVVAVISFGVVLIAAAGYLRFGQTFPQHLQATHSPLDTNPPAPPTAPTARAHSDRTKSDQQALPSTPEAPVVGSTDRSTASTASTASIANTPKSLPAATDGDSVTNDIAVCIVGSPEATSSSSHPSPTTTPNEIHYPTMEALLQAQSTPCRVRGLFDPKKKTKVMRAWSLATLRKNNLLRTAGLTLRVTEGANHTSVMRYSARKLRSSAEAFKKSAANVAFTPDTYDAWEFKTSTMDASVFSPRPNHSASFSSTASVFDGVHPKGAKAAEKLMKSVCPYGCTSKVATDRLVWIASAGLGQQLHFDAHANLFLHIDGDKSLVLVPPATVIRTAYLCPTLHPAGRQSQLRWDSSTPDRVVAGFTPPRGDDGTRGAPNYTHVDEQRVHLAKGDVVYLPPFWGHQTFSTNAGPTVSLALWFFPAAVDPRKHRGVDASYQREGGFDLAQSTAAHAVTAGAGSAAAAWGSLRALGESVVMHVFAIDFEAAVVILDEWRNQQWRPQYGSIGIDPTMSLPDAVCAAPTDRDAIDAAAERLATYATDMSKWHFAEHRESIDWLTVATILGTLVKLGAASTLRPDLETAGLSTSGQQFGALLQSFGRC